MDKKRIDIMEKAKEIQGLMILCDKLGVKKIPANSFPAISVGIALSAYGKGWTLKRQRWTFYLIKRL